MSKIITFADYQNRVKGGWYGKCLGGTIGCFEGTKNITDLDIMDLLPDQMVPNDDLDLQLIWMDVLLEKGVRFTSDQLMKAWLEEYDYNFGEYSVARRNYRRGLKPPVSGKYANLFFRNSMGCPIRSEIWGMIAPGNPDLAAQFACRDGILDHDGESVWAEQCLAAMDAAAFFVSDMEELLSIGLRYVPAHGMVYRCMETAWQGFRAGEPWRKTWKVLRDRYGHPDCTYAPQNMGILVLALLHGGCDFDRTLTITANAGWDVDCTCSTAAALLGILKGYDGFDPKWHQFVGEDIVTLARPRHEIATVSQLTEYTCQAGVTCLREGMSPEISVQSLPENFSYLKTADYTGEISLAVDYCGDPVIGAEEAKEIRILVQNPSPYSHSVRLRFTRIPEKLKLNKLEETVYLSGNASVSVPFCVQVDPNAEWLPDRNIFLVEAESEGIKKASYEFGLCGAPTVLVSDLYYDTYMDWLSVSDMPEKRLLKSKGNTVIIPEAPEEWGNHRADLHKPYMEEDFRDPSRVRQLFENARKLSVQEDVYSIRDAYGFAGSACVYYYQEVYSPEERDADIFTGSSDPFQLWLNGEMVQQQEECRFWYPYQHVTRVRLHKGRNWICIKSVRKGADNRLTVAFREEQRLTGFDSAPYLVDLQYATFAK